MSGGLMAVAYLDDVVRELERARRDHTDMKTFHEGYAVVLEELDELWAEIKQNPSDEARIYRELVQLGAMAVRFADDLFLDRPVDKS